MSTITRKQKKKKINKKKHFNDNKRFTKPFPPRFPGTYKFIPHHVRLSNTHLGFFRRQVQNYKYKRVVRGGGMTFRPRSFNIETKKIRVAGFFNKYKRYR
jgi:hypothetical protein